jgi:hypothetical protein
MFSRIAPIILIKIGEGGQTLFKLPRPNFIKNPFSDSRGVSCLHENRRAEEFRGSTRMRRLLKTPVDYPNLYNQFGVITDLILKYTYSKYYTFLFYFQIKLFISVEAESIPGP